MDQKQLKRVFFDAVKQRATQANPRVTHAKLLFDPTRPDANGKPRSRGIGFVEFAEHEHALAALRALNNNPTTFTSQRRPIVEFAVEDARAVRKLERRREGLDKAQRERDTERRRAARQRGTKRMGRKRRRAGRSAASASARETRARPRSPGGTRRGLFPERATPPRRMARAEATRKRSGTAVVAGATTPATKPATSAGSQLWFPSGSLSLRARLRRSVPATATRLPLASPAAKRARSAGDATDDLVDRHVARARGGARATRNRPRRSGDGSTTDARRGTVRSYRDAPEDAEDASARAPAYNRRIYVFIRIYYVRVRLIRLRVRFRARQTCRCFSDPRDSSLKKRAVGAEVTSNAQRARSIHDFWDRRPGGSAILSRIPAMINASSTKSRVPYCRS